MREFKIATSNTFKEWAQRFNELLDRLSSLPLPIDAGANSQMGYLKFANGKVIMWSRIDHGTRYPCNTEWQRSRVSSWFSVNYPVPLVNNTPIVIPFCRASKHPETFIVTRNITSTYVELAYLALLVTNELPDNAKTAMLLVLVTGNRGV